MALLARERVCVLLTGTSFKPKRDLLFWRAAAAAGVPSIAVVDHSINYLERFTVSQPFDALPDAIAVMDDVTAQRLRVLGCPPERLHVTGQPYFDELAGEGAAVRRDASRRELGVAPERTLVVFASEPQARFWGESPADPGYLGYTERDALAVVRAAVEEVAPSALLIVKLHPLEDPDAFHDLGVADVEPSVRVLRAYPSRHLIAAADVVFGMTSVFQLESALMGVPTISVRPGGRDNGGFFLDVHRELIDTVLDAADAAPALRRALARVPGHPPRSQAEFGVHAIARLTRLVYELALGVPREAVGAE